MRKSVLWNGIHVRLSLAVCIAPLISLAVAGCGGGGGGNNGGNNNPPPNTKLAVVSGTVLDTSGAPVKGAVLTIVGTNLSAASGSNGQVQINNVPVTATAFQVSSPSLTSYYNAGFYNGSYLYFGTDSGACQLALPPLKPASQGPSVLPTAIQLYVNSATSPPPPPLTSPIPAGCPKP